MSIRLDRENTAAKNEIFARIRNAQQLGQIDTSGYDIQRTYRTTSELSRAELKELFIDRLVDYKAQVEVTSAADLPATIARVLADVSASTVVYAEGLDAALFADFSGTATPDDRERDPRLLSDVDAVVTGSHYSAAQTGTICLESGPTNGRRALSLVPDRHICIVDMDTVVYGIPELVSHMDRRKPNTWISGPSATSDIELVRVEGVHGPRHLIVVIVE